MNKRKFIWISILLLAFILLIPHIILIIISRYINIEDSAKIKLRTNYVHLIVYEDLDGDGKFDIKEYCTWRARNIVSIKILNQDYDNILIKQTYKNGVVCIVSKTNRCNIESQACNAIYCSNKEIITAYGSFECKSDSICP